MGLELDKDYFVIDGLIRFPELIWIYHDLISTPGWHLMRSSIQPEQAMMPFMGFPGLDVETRGKVFQPKLSGYFRALVFRAQSRLETLGGPRLNGLIRRIHLSATNGYSKTTPHLDSKLNGAWTILAFMNPNWDQKNGGEFRLEDSVIPYESGRIVVFPSNLQHEGGFVTNSQMGYWRISANILITPQTPAQNA